MANYLIKEPQNVKIGDYNYKATKLYTRFGKDFYLRIRNPSEHTEKFWAIGMIYIESGNIPLPIVVSDVTDYAVVSTDDYLRDTSGTDYGTNGEIEYKGKIFHYGSNSAVTTDGDYAPVENAEIPVYNSEINKASEAALKLLELYETIGGAIPGVESSNYEKVEYTRINWENKSTSLKTPLNESNLNKMDKAIEELCSNLDIAHTESEVKKLDKSSANKLLSETPTWDPDTGILTFKFFDGTSFSVDFNIEKIPVSFSMDSAGVITMETADGTRWTADISKAIPSAYTFSNGERITFTETTGEDGAKKITADIVKGSITDEYLATDFLAKITSNVNAASSSAASAASSATDAAADAKLAQSYAIGGSGMRDGEDTDNAKYYAEQARTEKEKIEADLSDVAHFEDATGFGEAGSPDNPSMAEDITQLKKEVSNLSEIVGSISTTQF